MAPDKVKELVEKFELHKESYKSSSYNEAQLRREFLDQLFEHLGWDIDNQAGLAEAYKEVIHEDAIKIAGWNKAPDYSFRVGGVRKFFVEAKKPSVNLKDDTSPAFQLRRYAWSAKLPISILTDFEEFVIYDTRTRPYQSDPASKNRVGYYKYTDLVEKWDEVASIFSKEAVLKGSFDKFAESVKTTRGTSEVDDEFLKEIEKWRELLAKDLAKNNKELTVRELNYAVQKIIDRLIFLRIAEDRGIEEADRLKVLLNRQTRIYAGLCEYFDQADRKYNSGLFHFHNEKDISEAPDNLTQNLNISDETLKEIIKNLYYPDSPYEFSVLPADVLGQVYEQFLGKVIRLTESHNALVEDKPEVKKAGGVYYTPTYIVDYIVKNTVGKLVEGKTPKQVEKIKILDPACGSGSFLLGAYQYLLNWHLDYYIHHLEDKLYKSKNPVIFQIDTGDWRLTTSEKRRILINNIFGVDIDSQAVEVTKLSLLLKVLEGENQQTLAKQLRIFHERALPDLGNNIKCGNSLVGNDIYEATQLGLLGQEEQHKVNAFDWGVEFKSILDVGGFDSILGNPPWISLTGKFGSEISTPEEIKYLIKKFSGNTYMPNMYEYFVKLGLSLVKQDGFFSFIVPDRLGFNDQFISLRRTILKDVKILNLIYKLPFPKITADTLVFVFKKGKPDSKAKISVGEFGKELSNELQSNYLLTPQSKFEYYLDEDNKNLSKKIETIGTSLKDICEITSGFGGKSELITKNKISDKQIPIYKGENIGKYVINSHYWFEFRKENITGRTTNVDKLGAKEKILLRKTGDRIIATYDYSGNFPEQSLYFLFNKKTTLDFHYILGVLNSNLMTYYFRTKSLTNSKSIAQVKNEDLDLLPIKINFSSQGEKENYKNIIRLVKSVLNLSQNKPDTKSEHEGEQSERLIESEKKQIDKLVYELYNLTDKEIGIIENSMDSSPKSRRG